MRKKIFAVMIVAVVAVAASFNVYQSQNTNTLSDLALANVEALAQNEGGGSFCRWDSDGYRLCITAGIYTGCPCGSHNW